MCFCVHETNKYNLFFFSYNKIVVKFPISLLSLSTPQYMYKLIEDKRTSKDIIDKRTRLKYIFYYQ